MPMISKIIAVSSTPSCSSPIARTTNEPEAFSQLRIGEFMLPEPGAEQHRNQPAHRESP